MTEPQFAENFPVRWFDQAQISIAPDGAPVAQAGWSDQSALPPVDPGEFSVVLRHVHGIGHYFHFMELLIILHTVACNYVPELRLARIYVGRQHWNNMRQHGLQLELLRILYAGGVVIENFADSLNDRNVLVIDPEYTVTTINKFLQWVAPFATAPMQDMRRKVFRALEVLPATPARAGPLRVLYVHRNHARSVEPGLKDDLLTFLAGLGCSVRVLDYADISWSEQVRATAAVDLVIGAHGNGLTNILWAAPHAALIELFPDGFHDYAYQMLCEVAHLAYCGLQGVANDAYVTREFCRRGPSYGRAAGNIKAIPWRDLQGFINYFQSLLSQP